MHEPPNPELLDADTVAAYLVDRGIITEDAAAVEVLGGGISNVVLAISDRGRGLVLKQSLPRLRVVDDWPAPRERVLAEATALELAARLVPAVCPP